jgi:type IV pilus assembly protein PilB
MKIKMRISEKKLGQILLDRRSINESQLHQALNVQSGTQGSRCLGELLVDMGVHEDQILEAFLSQYRYPYIPIDRYIVDRAVIGLIPAKVARKYFVLPFEKMYNNLMVSMMNPLRREAFQELEEISQCCVIPCISRPSELNKMLKIYYAEAEVSCGNI